jgi:hypothetical protein
MENIIQKHEDKVIFYVCLGLAVALITFGVITPPPAIIDGSILTAVAELLGFAALGIVGKNLALGKDVKFKNGETEVTISDNEDEQR